MSEVEREELKEEIQRKLESDDELRLRMLADLKQAVLADIEKEALKKEILGELKPKETFWNNFFKHPAFLLIAGFILTTFLGSTLTSYWQFKNWSGQQKLASQQSIVKQKYEIKDEIIKTVAETNTAAEDTLASFLWKSNDSNLKSEFPDRIKAWREASKNWRKNSKILKNKLIFRFEDPQIKKVFDNIIYLRSIFGEQIDRYLKEIESTNKQILNDKNPQREKFVLSVYTTNGTASEFVKETENLMKLMLAEIKVDETKVKPQNDSLNEISFIQWIFS